jgi:hypothetical protein
MKNLLMIPSGFQIVITDEKIVQTMKRQSFLVKYYVFGQYPSFCFFPKKTVLFIFHNTTFRRLDSVPVLR